MTEHERLIREAYLQEHLQAALRRKLSPRTHLIVE